MHKRHEQYNTETGNDDYDVMKKHYEKSNGQVKTASRFNGCVIRVVDTIPTLHIST